MGFVCAAKCRLDVKQLLKCFDGPETGKVHVTNKVSGKQVQTNSTTVAFLTHATHYIEQDDESISINYIVAHVLRSFVQIQGRGGEVRHNSVRRHTDGRMFATKTKPRRFHLRYKSSVYHAHVV